MVVIILERVPESVRGELTRWLLEPKAGVFAGTVTAAVRERLWERVCGGMSGGAGILIYSTSTEQGFEIRFWGATRRSVLDWEGLKLISVPEGS
jgi:CRISPR-associated protein Cas2